MGGCLSPLNAWSGTADTEGVFRVFGLALITNLLLRTDSVMALVHK
jgi:hypothetical protein